MLSVGDFDESSLVCRPEKRRPFRNMALTVFPGSIGAVDGPQGRRRDTCPIPAGMRAGDGLHCSHAPRPRHLLRRPAFEKPPFRRLVLRRRVDDGRVLPPGLPGEAAEGAELSLLPERRDRREGRLSPVHALPPRTRARPRPARPVRQPRRRSRDADRGRFPGRPRRRCARATRRRDRAPSAADLRRAVRRVARRIRADAPPADGQAAADRYGAADGRRRVDGRVRQRAPLQRPVPETLRTQSAAAAQRRPSVRRRRHDVSVALPAAVRVGRADALSRSGRSPASNASMRTAMRASWNCRAAATDASRAGCRLRTCRSASRSPSRYRPR